MTPRTKLYHEFEMTEESRDVPPLSIGNVYFKNGQALIIYGLTHTCISVDYRK